MGEVGIEMTPEAVWARLRKDWLMVSRDHYGEIEAEALCFQAVGDDWFSLVAHRREQLLRYVSDRKLADNAALIVMIADAQPTDFLAGLWAALLCGWSVALASTRWGFQEWQSAQDIVQPQIIWKKAKSLVLPYRLQAKSTNTASTNTTSENAQPAILIPTGGSSGQPKFAHHTWQTLTSSVVGFHQHVFPSQTLMSAAHPTSINAYCVLPLYHVSGLLQALRTALTNGQLFLTPFKSLLSSHPPSVSTSPIAARGQHFISLVPTQLDRLLQTEKAAWLAQFHAVLLGGAPLWPSLLERGVAHKIPICLSYGMTETAAMVSATGPQTFLQARSSLGSGHAMPHAQIKIARGGQSLPTGEVGQVVVYSEAIAHGYYNAPSPDFAPNTFYTDDLGYLEADGTLHITGRASGKIISGGENIFPAEVEAALRNTGQVHDVCVVGLPNAVWGEAISAAYVPKDATVSPKSLKAALVKETAQNLGGAAPPALSRYKVPKYWFPLPHLPRNAQGKINRSALLAQLKPLSKLSAQQATADDDGSED